MEWQAAWLLRAVTCIDLTTLAGDDTEANVKRLCFKAKSPIRKDMLQTMGVANKNITVGAVCVYPNRVKEAVTNLKVKGFHVSAAMCSFCELLFQIVVEEFSESVCDPIAWSTPINLIKLGHFREPIYQ